MSMADPKGWGGGCAIIGDSHSSNDSSITLRSTPSITPPATTRRNMGGRRPNKDKNVSTLLGFDENKSSLHLDIINKNGWLIVIPKIIFESLAYLI